MGLDSRRLRPASLHHLPWEWDQSQLLSSSTWVRFGSAGHSAVGQSQGQPVEVMEVEVEV